MLHVASQLFLATAQKSPCLLVSPPPSLCDLSSVSLEWHSVYRNPRAPVSTLCGSFTFNCLNENRFFVGGKRVNISPFPLGTEKAQEAHLLGNAINTTACKSFSIWHCSFCFLPTIQNPTRHRRHNFDAENCWVVPSKTVTPSCCCNTLHIFG